MRPRRIIELLRNNHNREQSFKVERNEACLEAADIIEKMLLDQGSPFVVQPEKHCMGMLTIESMPKSSLDADVGLQVSEDGRIWVCVDGKAFIRFKPKIKAYVSDEEAKDYYNKITEGVIGGVK